MPRDLIPFYFTRLKLRKLHSWQVTPTEARIIQTQLRSEIIETRLPNNLKLVAGADISYDRDSDILYAAIVVLELPDLQIIEIATAVTEVNFPYIPGLLSFREGPAVLKAWGKLEYDPDVVIFDGHGLAHPRRFGLACHLGLWLDIPAIGCAKSRLIGNPAEPGQERGAKALLMAGEENIGVVLRTRTAVKPVFVSTGHKIYLKEATELVLHCTKGYRLPETTRQAHLVVNRLSCG